MVLVLKIFNMKKKTIVYENEKNQDFSTVKVNPGKLNRDFVFVHKNIFYRFISFIFYYFAIIILHIFEKCLHKTKIVNKKAIDKLKNTGFFIYSNHTTISDGYQQQAMVLLFKKRGYVVSMQDTFVTNKFLQNIFTMLGGIPIPTELRPARNFLKCLETRLKQKAAIVIYPEATIWPYYTSQRPSKPGAFKYPRTFNVPVIFSCTTFRKPTGLFKKFKKPKIVLYISEPIYPSRELIEKDDELRIKKLYEEFIEEHSSIKENYEYYKYVADKLDKDYIDNN